jgi:soluble cytochrome b562
MTDGELYVLMVKQKDFILELIKKGKINEATASYETVKDLWLRDNIFLHM